MNFIQKKFKEWISNPCQEHWTDILKPVCKTEKKVDDYVWGCGCFLNVAAFIVAASIIGFFLLR